MRKIRKNLLSAWNSVDGESLEEGKGWYRRARKDCENLAKKYKVGLVTVCGVVAALSPGLKWDRNIAEAEKLLSDPKVRMIGAYGKLNMLKARRILEGEEPLEVLGGEKVRAFYKCLVDPENVEDVCVDRHMICVAFNKKMGEIEVGRIFKSPAKLRKIREGYLKVAEGLGVKPSELQAILWVWWRKQ